MWKFLLDPAVQAVAFLLAVSALGYVIWDIVDDARDPSPPADRMRKPRAPPRETAAPRRSPRVEPSVEIWTDGVGETRGRVRRGPSRGLRLEDMNREECEAQAAYAREHDPPRALAIDSYIRHRFGRERRFEPKIEAEFTRAEALAELGLREGASEAEIHSAYRKLIMTHHPDRGGSHAKAARLNQAKDMLAG